MGASTTVLYVLEAGGNLIGSLPSLAAGLDAVKAKAEQTATTVGGALQSAATKTSSGFKSLSEELGNLSGGLFRAIAGLTFFAVGVNKALSSNLEWERATARLTFEVTKLQKSFADAVGPTAAKSLDSFTIGLIGIVDAVKDLVIPSFEVFEDLIKGLSTEIGTFLKIADALRHLDLAGAKRQIAVLQAQEIVTGANVINTLTSNWETFKADVASGIGDLAKVNPAIKSISYTDEAKKFQPLEYALYSLAADLRDKALPALDKAQGALGDTLAELRGPFLSNLKTSLQQAAIQNAANSINGFSQAANGGISGIASTFGGPIGALVGAILDAFNNLPDLIQGLSDQALDIFVGLPSKLGDILGTVLPNLIVTLIPQLVQAFFLLPTQIVFALLKSAPALFASLIELGPQIALTFADQFERMLSSLFSPSYWATVIRQAWDGLKGQLGQTFGSLGSILGTNLGPNADVKRFLGIKIPKLDDGGVIARSGLVFAHAGERYLGAPGSATQRATSGSGTTINIGQLSVGDIRSIAAALRRSRGSYGLGLKIDALA